MSEVEKARLSIGNIFRSKDVVKLRIAEEANLRGISTRVQRSNVMTLTVVGINVYVHATVYENKEKVNLPALNKQQQLKYARASKKQNAL